MKTIVNGIALVILADALFVEKPEWSDGKPLLGEDGSPVEYQRVPLGISALGKTHHFMAHVKDARENPEAVARQLIGMALTKDGDVPEFEVSTDVVDFIRSSVPEVVAEAPSEEGSTSPSEPPSNPPSDEQPTEPDADKPADETPDDTKPKATKPKA